DFADADKIIESRYLATTGRKLSQWTGYHAEMIVLSAMLCANAWDPKKIANIGGKLAEAGGALICANATACHHCGELMDSLKVAYYGDKGEKSNTAWWNPLTDAVIQKDGAGW
ncbi:MAG: hypothetical protein KGL59_15390, partial [Acidobacteriota bacterium]|nr:hypothetical protein [Acidobacteriota bacterium]